MPRNRNREPEPADDRLDYGLWWVSRWVSGSMDDPDWSWPEAEAVSVEDAFATVRERIGNARVAGGPFWRFLSVDEVEAARLEDGGDLMPNPKRSFQSFTTERACAEEFGEDGPGQGDVPVLVRVDVPPECVMFGMADLKGDRKARDVVSSLDLWHHQKEVMVLVDRPMRVLEMFRGSPAPGGSIAWRAAGEELEAAAGPRM